MVSDEELLVHTLSAVDVIAGDIDLLSEILIRLPAKPLLRFKSVSKRWLSLISSPHFYRRHVCRKPNAVSGLFLHGLPDNEYYKVGFLSLNRNPSVAAAAAHFKSADINFTGDPGIRIKQSCNGLLFCCSLDSKINWYIVNPATKQCSMLPPLTDAIAKRSLFHGIHLAFDPLKSPYCKAVCSRRVGIGSRSCQMVIYSNESGIWRNSGDPFIVPYGMVLHNGVFSNGALHWISPRGGYSMYFNVEEERIGTMPPLPFTVAWGGNRRFRYFGESFGHLHLLEIVGSQTTQFKVFELEKDYSKWFLKFNVDLDPIVNAHPDMIRPYLDPGDSYCAFNILSIVREEDDGESSLLLHIPGEIISYKFKDKSFRKLHDFAPSSRKNGGVRQFGCINAYQYIETLACIHSCT